MTDQVQNPEAIAQSIWSKVQALPGNVPEVAGEIRSLHAELQKEFGRYHICTLTAQVACGIAAYYEEDLARATTILIQVRQKLNAGYHWCHPLFVDLYGAMSLVYVSQELYLEAQALIELALEISEHVYGIGAPSTAELHLRLGDALCAQQLFDTAQEHYGSSLALYKELGKPDHLIATLKLGELFYTQSRFEQSAAILEEAAGSAEFLTLSPGKMVHTLEILRESLHMIGQANKAALFELQRIQIVFETEKLTPIQKVNIYHRFLTLFELIEIPDLRETACRDLLELTERACGNNSYAWAEAAQLLGECYCLSKKFDEARKHLEAALTYFNSHPDQVQAQVAEILKTLGSIELYLQNPTQAEKYLNEALHEFSARNILNSVAYVQTLQALALLDRTLGKKESAIANLKKIVEVASQVEGLLLFGDQARAELTKLQSKKQPEVRETLDKAVHDAADNLNRVGVLFNQALQLRDSREYSKALRVFEEILSIMENAQGGKHPDLRPILEQIGYTHQQLGNSELAHSFSERAKSLSSP